MQKNIENNLLGINSTVGDVARTLNKGVLGIVFIVDENHAVQGLYTDGDLRRAFLDGAKQETPAKVYMQSNFQYMREGDSKADAIQMLSDTIRHIPILDENNRLKDFVSWNEMLRVPLVEPHLGGNELKYVSDCITSNWISSQGGYVIKFETEFSEYIGANYSITTSNGTSALHLALLALEIGEGDEVIIPNLTFAATANAVLHCGAKPILVDVERHTWNIDPNKLRDVVTRRTKAIIPVHLYGRPANMDAILTIAREKEIFVIEDAAEALGARYNDTNVGVLGDIGCFSFFSNKIITTGEGGMLITNDEEISKKVKLYRDHGMSRDKRYWHDVVGYNYRMTNMQAAIGVAQLERLEDFIQLRSNIANKYRQRLDGLAGLTLPYPDENSFSVNWLYSLLIDQEKYGISRNVLMEKMRSVGIETRPFFYPLNEQPPYKQSGEFSNSAYLSSCGISLPSSNSMSNKDVDKVCEYIIEFSNS